MTICPECGTDKQAYYETMGEPCCPGEEQFVYTGLGGKQVAYWWQLESHTVSRGALQEGTEPLPEIEIARN